MNRKYGRAVFGMSIGLAFAAVMGAALHSVALGVVLGVGLGIAFAMPFSAESDAAMARRKAAADKPLPDPLGLFTR